MKDKTDDLVLTGIILIIFILLVAITIFSIAINNMLIDHKCYMMTDEEFFQTEMCKPYWSYRQVGKK